jgi:protein-disulfide isomerase
MNKNTLIGASAIGLFIAFYIASVFFRQSLIPDTVFLDRPDLSTFIRDYSPTLSPGLKEGEKPKVVLVEFLDPQCGTCRAFYPMVKKILHENEGNIQLVIRYATFHDQSEFVVKILEAARKQGKYWETLESIFSHQPEWGDHHNPKPDLIWNYLGELSLNIDQIKADMESPGIKQRIDQDMADAKTLNMKATPGFFINGQPLEKFGIEFLLEAIQNEIK